MTESKIKCIGVMTSGGDSPGMNAAVRAVVKTALIRGIEVYALLDGYQGMVDGGDMIKKMGWGSVGGILHKGGTIIGTARCKEFREREGRVKAAMNLVERGIDNLVVIGGDGSLTGANLFSKEWPAILAELLEQKKITKAQAEKHPRLNIVGLVGSIDNDLSGTDMTIGADTALRRIADALDALSSTAASHQRTFVVEVMGRNCGYLALISALTSGADYVFIPERPPLSDDWAAEMCEKILENKKEGKRKSLIIISEGAKDKLGNPIKSHEVVEVLQSRIGVDARLTILGHVQRGGAPTAFDRYMSTVLGYAAVQHLINNPDEKESKIIALQKNTVKAIPLMESIRETQSVPELIASKQFDKAIELRGGTFAESLHTFNTLSKARPFTKAGGKDALNFLIMNSGTLAPGMNTAVRTAVRLAIDKGHRVFGVRNGFKGLIANDIFEFNWMQVEDWTSIGGSEIGTNRKKPEGREYYQIAKNLEANAIDGLLIIGGITGYMAAYNLLKKRSEFPAFEIPIVCLPATINNNLPGTDFSIGSDTALNSIIEAVDKIKESAVANQRVFVVEVMGRYCGFLAMLSGLATGAERVYLHENGVTLQDLQNDVNMFRQAFDEGKRMGLVIKSEYANAIYTTPFISALYEEDGGDAFDVPSGYSWAHSTGR
ncbi:MAG: 6-phosphofructokinase [Cyclobacteriaceae bacterium]|nr:6-phosphofructokinase [Cyclobacteriaceae bacterium]